MEDPPTTIDVGLQGDAALRTVRRQRGAPFPVQGVREEHRALEGRRDPLAAEGQHGVGGVADQDGVSRVEAGGQVGVDGPPQVRALQVRLPQVARDGLGQVPQDGRDEVPQRRGGRVARRGTVGGAVELQEADDPIRSGDGSRRPRRGPGTPS